MTNHFVSYQAAEAYARDHTSAGYIDPFIILTDDNMEVLKKGECLLFCGEYGVLIITEQAFDKQFKDRFAQIEGAE